MQNQRLLIAMTLLFPMSAAAAQPPIGPPVLDATKVLGSDSCLKCHGPELEVWKSTPHFSTFRSLHKNPAAQAISERMGVRSIKRGGLCVKCHYTEKEIGGRHKAISGVSCESCHGAAEDWIALHNDYGSPSVTKAEETPAHRQQRLENSIKNGMQNPANLYLIARSCFNCHSVPHEELVNVGGHVAGSKAFELVSWSQGMVRHNFLRGNGTNAASDPQRKRVMFVVGLMTDLEFSLRATAAATVMADYGRTSAWRAFELRRRLADIQAIIQNEQLHTALVHAYDVKLKSNNADKLRAAADAVGQAAFEFAESEGGSNLSAIDHLLPPESAYVK